MTVSGAPILLRAPPAAPPLDDHGLGRGSCRPEDSGRRAFMTEAARLAQLLASRLQTLWGAAVEITDVRQLAGGASRESWGAAVRTAGGAERRLILLRDMKGVREAGGGAASPG